MSDNSLKTTLQASIASYVASRSNDFQQNAQKGIPCRVTKVDQDFVEVSFEPQNQIYTIPTVKMAQSFSPYAREPTQVGDLGYAVPSDYSLNTVSGFGGGNTNFYSKPNLTSLSFQPISHQNNVSRDYNQYTLTGGPTGVKIIQSAPQQSSSQPSLAAKRNVQKRLLHYSTAAKQAWLRTRTPVQEAPKDNSTPQSYMQIDKNGQVAQFVTTDGKHQVWLGGSGAKPQLYAPLMTVEGPAVNVMAKYVAQDD